MTGENSPFCKVQTVYDPGIGLDFSWYFMMRFACFLKIRNTTLFHASSVRLSPCQNSTKPWPSLPKWKNPSQRLSRHRLREQPTAEPHRGRLGGHPIWPPCRSMKMAACRIVPLGRNRLMTGLGRWAMRLVLRDAPWSLHSPSWLLVWKRPPIQ